MGANARRSRVGVLCASRRWRKGLKGRKLVLINTQAATSAGATRAHSAATMAPSDMASRCTGGAMPWRASSARQAATMPATVAGLASRWRWPLPGRSGVTMRAVGMARWNTAGKPPQCAASRVRPRSKIQGVVVMACPVLRTSAPGRRRGAGRGCPGSGSSARGCRRPARGSPAARGGGAARAAGGGRSAG